MSQKRDVEREAPSSTGGWLTFWRGSKDPVQENNNAPTNTPSPSAPAPSLPLANNELSEYGLLDLRIRHSVAQVKVYRLDYDPLDPSPQPSPVPSFGSSFLVDKERRWMMTNSHVAQAAKGIQLFFPALGQAPIPARIHLIIPHKDVAILEMQDTNEWQTLAQNPYCAAFPAHRSDHLVGHEPIVAVGYPLGMPEITTTPGVLSGRNYLNERFMLKTTANLNPGNSGGPAFYYSRDHREYRWVGINTSHIPSAKSINFVLPSETILPCLAAAEKLAPNPNFPHIMAPMGLGLDIRRLPKPLAQRYGNKLEGGLLHNVAEGSMSFEAGLQENDVLQGYTVTVNGVSAQYHIQPDLTIRFTLLPIGGMGRADFVPWYVPLERIGLGDSVQFHALRLDHKKKNGDMIQVKTQPMTYTGEDRYRIMNFASGLRMPRFDYWGYVMFTEMSVNAIQRLGQQDTNFFEYLMDDHRMYRGRLMIGKVMIQDPDTDYARYAGAVVDSVSAGFNGVRKKVRTTEDLAAWVAENYPWMHEFMEIHFEYPPKQKLVVPTQGWIEQWSGLAQAQPDKFNTPIYQQILTHVGTDGQAHPPDTVFLFLDEDGGAPEMFQPGMCKDKECLNKLFPSPVA